MVFKAFLLPKMVTSSKPVCQWLNNLLCQHLDEFCCLLLCDFVEDSARKSNAARNIPKASANHPKYISVGKMPPAHDGDRCCLSREHLEMWACLKPVSSCQENLFHWCLMRRPSNSWCWPGAGAHRRTLQDSSHLGHFWPAASGCRFSFFILILQTLICR